MNRLTKRNENGDLLLCGKEVYGNNSDIYNSISLLEEYEDTGLAPEEIIRIIKGGVPEWIDKYLEYRKLEAEGLLIKLPCNVGEVVYLLSSPINVTNFEEEFNEGDILIFECEVQSISKYKDGNQVRLYWNNKFVGWYLTLEDFGKVIFLTKEEAEKALEETNDKNS